MNDVKTVDAVAEEVVTPQTETQEPQETTTENVESESVETEVAPVTDDKQSQEENAKFAEVRRKAEAKANEKLKELEEKIANLESNPSMNFVETQAKKYKMSTDAYIEARRQQEVDFEVKQISEKENVTEDIAKRLYNEQLLTEKTANDVLTKKQQEQKQAYMDEFVSKYPDVDPESIPKEVYHRFNEGDVSLVDAYAIEDNAILREKLSKYEDQVKVQERNEENTIASTGSVTGNGEIKSELTDEAISKMSPKQLMSRWKEVKKVTGMK